MKLPIEDNIMLLNLIDEYMIYDVPLSGQYGNKYGMSNIYTAIIFSIGFSIKQLETLAHNKYEFPPQIENVSFENDILELKKQLEVW